MQLSGNLERNPSKPDEYRLRNRYNINSGEELHDYIQKNPYGVAFDNYLKLYTYDEVEADVQVLVDQKFCRKIESDPKSPPVLFPIVR